VQDRGRQVEDAGTLQLRSGLGPGTAEDDDAVGPVVARQANDRLHKLVRGEIGVAEVTGWFGDLTV